MKLVGALLACTLLCPLAAALGGDPANPTPAAGEPPASSGNNGSAPAAQESVESPPGIGWYVGILVGMLAVGAVLAYVMVKQGRDGSPPPP